MNRACASCGATDGDAPLDGVTIGGPCRSCGRDPNVGRVVSNVTLTAPLGAGGMGRIYRGVHNLLGTPVAVKLLAPSLASDVVLRKRFRREAVALSRLRHPGIVSLLDFGSDGADLYAVMELVEGAPLGQLARAHDDKLPLARAAAIIDQLLAALEACHDAGVVHRDLKPDNVMVTEEGGVDRVTLLDFGLAHGAQLDGEKLTNSGTVHGTPEYMAPEQCRGEDVGPPADVYALGVVFFELLTGTAPFDAADPGSYMAQHLFVDPPDVRSLDPTIPVGVAALVMQALSKSPTARPSARDFRASLARALDGTDAHARQAASTTSRQQASELRREDRLLADPTATLDVPPAAYTVVVWMPRDTRSGSLRGALGAAGITSSQVEGEPLEEAPMSALVVSALHDGVERARTFRARHPEAPIVVIDVPDPSTTTRAIRAGASDFALEGAPDAELGPKIKRLIARRTRRPS